MCKVWEASSAHGKFPKQLLLFPSVAQSTSQLFISLLGKGAGLQGIHQLTQPPSFGGQTHIAPKDRILMTAGSINTDHRRASGMQYPVSNQQLRPSLRVLPLVVPSSMSRKICQSRGSSSARAEHAHWRGKSLKDLCGAWCCRPWNLHVCWYHRKKDFAEWLKEDLGMRLVWITLG